MQLHLQRPVRVVAAAAGLSVGCLGLRRWPSPRKPRLFKAMMPVHWPSSRRMWIRIWSLPKTLPGQKAWEPCAHPIPQILILPFPLPHLTWVADGRFGHSSGAAHSTVTIMDVDSSATIKHIWIVAGQGLHGVGRANILRFYWDGEETPSVEVPLSDFFAIGHETFAPVTSAMVVDIPMAGRLLLADQAVAPGLADPLADSREPDVYSR